MQGKAKEKEQPMKMRAMRMKAMKRKPQDVAVSHTGSPASKKQKADEEEVIAANKLKKVSYFVSIA